MMKEGQGRALSKVINRIEKKHSDESRKRRRDSDDRRRCALARSKTTENAHIKEGSRGVRKGCARKSAWYRGLKSCIFGGMLMGDKEMIRVHKGERKRERASLTD